MTQTIQERGDTGVIDLPCKLHDESFDFYINGPAMLPRAILDHALLGMVAALPMNDELDLCVGNTCHDFLDNTAQNALAYFVVRRRMGPYAWQIRAQCHQFVALAGRDA